MAGISLSGLASGLDWQSLITQLITAERTPETAWKAQQTKNMQKITAFSTLGTDLTALKTAADALKTSGTFAARSATVANASSGWTASAAASTATGDYSLQVLQLATKATRVGSTDVGAPLSSSSDVTGVTLATINLASTLTAGNFTVNGAQVSVSLSDSLQDVFDKIATATNNTVTASYDPVADKIQLNGSGEIVLGAANDSSNFLSATKLFNNGSGDIQSTGALGAVNVNSALAIAHLKTGVTNVDTDGNGSFTVNGVNISFNINNDSVQGIVARINASGAGVTASYDNTNDQFKLTNNTTGDNGIALSESAGGLLEALGLNSTATLVHGQNAQYKVNGGQTLTSTSNTLDASSHGIAGLSVTATSVSTQTISVAGDSSDAKTKINNFISAYNTVQSFIDAQTKTSTSGTTVTTSTLSGNRDVTDLQKQLRSMVFGAVPGLSGSIQRLESIGIDFTSGTSQLAVQDSAKLDDAILNHGDEVKSLFNSSGGLVSQLDAFVTKTTASSGLLATETDTLTKQSKNIDTQIASLETRLIAEQAKLTASFVAMEQAQSQLQSESTALTNAFGTTSSSSSKSS